MQNPLAGVAPHTDTNSVLMIAAGVNPGHLTFLHNFAEYLKRSPPLPLRVTKAIRCALAIIPENGFVSTRSWILQGFGPKKISILYVDASLRSGTEFSVFKAHQIFMHYLHNQLVIQFQPCVVKVPNSDVPLTGMDRNFNMHRNFYNKLAAAQALIAKPGVMLDYEPFPLSIHMERYDSNLFDAGLSGFLIPLNVDHPTVPLSPVQIAHFLVGILRTLELIHKEGYVHSDLKSANLLLKEMSPGKWNCFLSDFGLIEKVGRFKVLFDYIYWCPLSRLFGVVTPYSDVWGVAITLGGLIFNEASFNRVMKEDILDPRFQESLRDEVYSSLHQITPFHKAVFDLVVTTLQSGHQHLPLCRTLTPLAKDITFQPFTEEEKLAFSTLPTAAEFADKLEEIIS